MRGENAQQQLARSVVFARPSAATSLPSAAFAGITAQHASMAVRKKPSVNTLLIQGEIITGRYWTDSTRSNISFKPYPPQSSLRHRHQHIQNHPSSLLTTSSPRSPLSTAKSRERSAPHSAANQCSAGPSSTSVVSEEDARIESFVLEFGNDLTDDSVASSSASTIGISEDSLVPLCRKLLQHVHPLNPVLEGRDLLAYAKRASEHGIGWDSPSYLVTRAEEERSWLCYLADISLRRTIKDTVAVLYHQDERHWLGNKLVLARQYDEFEKKIPELSVCYSAYYHDDSQPTESHRATNELSFYLQGRFQGCGSWFVGRRAFSCAVMILAARLKDAHVTVPQNWRALRVMRR
ncbi:hypothetical protein C8035_v011539 [Colletotrichum spinosum]|uniref:Uncharacterized protein n=1 Tax=Colletotrichum spinosum TaxID=1347390 RepID=A0A4V3HS33_9PEZI|nr:hypothetical protein C8035_v011539 [Colletotrichum spinosum]